MKPKSLFRLAIQICGLYVMFGAFMSLPSVISNMLILAGHPEYSAMYGGWLLMATQILTFALPVIIGTVLIFAAKKIASFFIHEEDEEPLNVKKEDILEIIIVVIGIVTVIGVIPDAVTSFKYYTGGIFQDYIPYALIPTGLKILVGLIFIWKARALSRYTMRLPAIEAKPEDGDMPSYH